MTLASGLGSQFVLAKESSYAVIPGSPAWRAFEFDSADMVMNPNYDESVGIQANRTFQPVSRMRQTTREAGGSSPMDVPTKGFGSILDLLHGLSATPVQQASTTAYKSTHNVGTSQPSKSAVLQVNKPFSSGSDYPVTFPGSILVSCAFELAVSGHMKVTPTWDSQDELTPDTSPAGPSLVVPSYLSDNSNFIGSVGITVSIAGTPVAIATAVRWTWTQPYKTDRWFLGSGALKAKPIPNGFATITGELDVEWFDGTAYAQYRNDSTVAIVVDAQGRTISGIYKEQFKNTFAATKLRGGSAGIDGPDVLNATIPFTVGDDRTNVPWVSEYQSTDVAL